MVWCLFDVRDFGHRQISRDVLAQSCECRIWWKNGLCLASVADCVYVVRVFPCPIFVQLEKIRIFYGPLCWSSRNEWKFSGKIIEFHVPYRGHICTKLAHFQLILAETPYTAQPRPIKIRPSRCILENLGGAESKHSDFRTS